MVLGYFLKAAWILPTLKLKVCRQIPIQMCFGSCTRGPTPSLSLVFPPSGPNFYLTSGENVAKRET